jgi:hypothetical protein
LLKYCFLKLGSDKLINYNKWYRLKCFKIKLGRELLKIISNGGVKKCKYQFMGVKFHQKISKMGIEKSRRFGVFLVHFYHFLSLLDSIAIYRKTGPTKSTVLGPGPPPGNFYKIIENYRFFTIFGPSIEPEKRSLKSASTANPPPKTSFYSISYKFATQFRLSTVFLLKLYLYHWDFNLSRPNFGIVFAFLL